MGNTQNALPSKQATSPFLPFFNCRYSILPSQLQEDKCECLSYDRGSGKNEQLLSRISDGSLQDGRFSKTSNQQTKNPILIPISSNPKLLSSLSNTQSKVQIQWKNLMSKNLDSRQTINQVMFSKGNISDIINESSGMFNAPQKYSTRLIAIKKQIFYTIRKQPIEEFYHISKKIGEGGFGSVYEGFCKRSKQIKAIKVLKKKCMTKKDESKMLSEVNLLKRLDHINIIKLDDIFVNNNFYYIVTEFCEGGTLLDALVRKKIKSEKEIAIIMRQVLSAVSYIHQLKIAHMDLKLENIVLVKSINKTNINQCVKIIDFGLAMESPNFFKNKCGKVGTLSYMAPELFNNYFSCHSDIWSCGIILCILLIGFNPYKRKKPELTMTAILNDPIDCTRRQWKNVSANAKQIVEGMLKKQPFKRMPISRILTSQWFQSTKQQSIERIEDKDFMSRVAKFYRDSNFHAFIKNYIISKGVTQAQRQQMAVMFSKLDQDHSGFLEFKQILSLYQNVKGGPLSEQLQQLLKSQMQKIDYNKSGKIDFQEFQLLMTNIDSIKSKKYLSEAFDFFDRDKTGYIERDEFIDCLEDEGEVQNLIGLIDWNGDGRISREEFGKYFESCFQQ